MPRHDVPPVKEDRSPERGAGQHCRERGAGYRLASRTAQSEGHGHCRDRGGQDLEFASAREAAQEAGG